MLSTYVHDHIFKNLVTVIIEDAEIMLIYVMSRIVLLDLY